MTILSIPAQLKVMIAGLFSLILTMGVARFSYTPLLPVMMDETFLTDATGGWLATINYMGYMSGALLAASISDLKLKDTLYRIGLLLSIVTTIGMAFAENYILWSIMRYFAGFGAAAGLLIGSGLILNWMLRHGYRAELGVHFAGAGLGIATSAAVAMLMVGKFDWVQQWQVFAVVGVFLAIPAWFWLPKPDVSQRTTSGKALQDSPPKRSWMWILYAAYFCAGVGYVVTATFLVTIVDTQESLQGYGSMVWLITGLAAAPACIIWDRIARKIGELQALFIAYGLNIIGVIIPAFDSSLAGIIFSGLLFGATFIGIVSLMLTMVGKFFPTKPAKPMGKLTLSYGTAQIIAPALSGSLAEASGNYNTPLMMAAIMMAIGMGLIALLYSLQQK
ncbi:MAG: YbfB/YjiJ family MFS transporter [Cocleimonas sp.]|nr:YbfB/YjiJ family MFS transporter [Cocleimonas sp.]